jgi:hypothetical protein
MDKKTFPTMWKDTLKMPVTGYPELFVGHP